MIEIKELSFSYDDKKTLDKVSLNVEKGKITTLIGPNGCGKTTLLKCISGIERNFDGTVNLDGKNVLSYSLKELALKMSVLAQYRGISSISVKTFVSHGRFPHLDISRKMTQEDKQKVSEALETAGVTHLADRMIDELSGGERQRVYIAMTLAQDTPYVLMDEPTTYLDISHKIDIMKLMESMKKSGKTMLCVLHDLSLALHYSDTVAVMENGKIISISSPEQAVRDGVIDRVFSVKCIGVDTPCGKEYVFYKQ